MPTCPSLHWPPREAPARADYVSTTLAGSRLLDVLALSDAAAVAVAEAPGEPQPTLLTVPLLRVDGEWCQATARDGVAEALVRRIGDPVPDPFALRGTARAAGVVTGLGHRTGERAITVDQTNESVVVADTAIVKWMRHPVDAEHPAPLLLSHLDEVGFRAIPAPLGFLTWRSPRGHDVLLATVDGFLPDSSDGWEWCVDAVLDHLGHAGRNGPTGGVTGPCPPGCPARFAGRLGDLTARLHTALATPSSVIPAPVSHADHAALAEWRVDAEQTLERALALLEEEQRAALAPRLPAMRAAVRLLGELPATPVQPVHGDLHVGQVLRWRDGLAVIDFDGNPVEDPARALEPRPAARDVAQMLSSLDHVGRIADRRTDGMCADAVAAWIARATADFLDAYRRQLHSTGHAQLLDEALLEPFWVTQECRELVYAAEFLPRWTYAPMGALTAMFPAAEETV